MTELVGTVIYAFNKVFRWWWCAGVWVCWQTSWCIQ